METGKFYEGILGLTEGWTVKNVERSDANETVYVQVVFASGHYKCPNCSKDAAPHDKRERVVQHSDTCEYKTMLNVEYPRVKCLSCGVKAIIPPFAAANSRFTKAFEKRILQLCFSSSVQKVAKDLKLHWHVVDRMKRRAIKRGLDRMKKRHGRSVKNIAIDETSFQKRHNYSMIVPLPNTSAATIYRPCQQE